MFKNEIQSSVDELRKYFGTDNTKDIDFRISSLKKLSQAIHQYSDKITNALWTDLHKSYEEAYLTEISLVQQEIQYHCKNLKQWAKPKKVKTPLQYFPSGSKVLFEPLGVCLIMAPWNYPFQLVLNPLIGAIAAGCCVVLKPSPDTPNVATVIAEIIGTTFPQNYITVIQGGKEVSEVLLSIKFDGIFFTGSTNVGKIVMKAAAEHLTPVILELGGKSPCIVDKDANIEVAAKRIVWAKTINAGQTCIAPDYVFVHEQVKEQLIAKMKLAITSMYGQDEQQSAYYGRIIHARAFERLVKYLNDGTIVYGGKYDSTENYIQPTILDHVSFESAIMQDEIFGPLLPLFSFSKPEEAVTYINSKPQPLGLYYFGNKNTGNKIFTQITFGGGCINDTLLHIGNHHLPFGGVGYSGMGKYHGKYSFLAFSNQKSVMESSPDFDIPFKYPPYRFFNWIKRIV